MYLSRHSLKFRLLVGGGGGLGDSTLGTQFSAEEFTAKPYGEAMNPARKITPRCNRAANDCGRATPISVLLIGGFAIVSRTNALLLPSGRTLIADFILTEAALILQLLSPERYVLTESRRGRRFSLALV